MELYHISVVRICITLTIFCHSNPSSLLQQTQAWAVFIYLDWKRNENCYIAKNWGAGEKPWTKNGGAADLCIPKSVQWSCAWGRDSTRTDLPSRDLWFSQNSPPWAPALTPPCLQKLVQNQNASPKCSGDKICTNSNLTWFKIPPHSSGPVDASSPKPHPCLRLSILPETLRGNLKAPTGSTISLPCKRAETFSFQEKKKSSKRATPAFFFPSAFLSLEKLLRKHRTAGSRTWQRIL